MSNICYMPNINQHLHARTAAILADLGERLRLARLRREMSAETLASRASISRMTLHRVERGESGVALAIYVRIMAALDLDEDFGLLAKEDAPGRLLQDEKLKPKRQR